MKFKSGTELMNLPNYIKFGCEIEAQNVDIKKFKLLLKQDPDLKGWKITKDASLTDNGGELISPPLSEMDNPKIYENMKKALAILKSCPYDKTRNVYTNDQCGGHIHFDAGKIMEKPEMANALLRLYAEAELLIYKICTPPGDPIREGAIKLSPVDGIRRILFSVQSELIKAGDRISSHGASVKEEIPKAFIQGGKKTIRGFSMILESLIAKHGFSHPTGDTLNKVGKKDDYVKEVISTSKGKKIRFNRKLKDLTKHQSRNQYAKYCRYKNNQKT